MVVAGGGGPNIVVEVGGGAVVVVVVVSGTGISSHEKNSQLLSGSRITIVPSNTRERTKMASTLRNDNENLLE